jgi:hypothetical protein
MRCASASADSKSSSGREIAVFIPISYHGITVPVKLDASLVRRRAAQQNFGTLDGEEALRTGDLPIGLRPTAK